MLKARNARYSVPLRYGKVLLCGATAAGKSNLFNLLMEEDFQSLHISTGVLKPQQVTIAMKAVVHSNDDKVEFKRMNIDDEILQLESYLPEKYTEFTSTPHSLQVSTQDTKFKHVKPTRKLFKPKSKNVDNTTGNDKLVLVNLKSKAEKLVKKPNGEIWDLLTFMDTGGQPQFISMLPAVNSFAMITFIVHKMESDGQKSLNKIVEVQYGNEKGEIISKMHPHSYTYHQLIETLISYASNIYFVARHRISSQIKS